MAYAAEHYGVEAVGVSISQEQVAWARERRAGLPLEFRLQDYLEVDEPFDAIASIGMFEHMGRRNHRHYMEVAHRCLRADGLFLLHTIGKNQRKSSPDPWIDKYNFPNGDLPSIGQIGDAVDSSSSWRTCTTSAPTTRHSWPGIRTSRRRGRVSRSVLAIASIARGGTNCCPAQARSGRGTFSSGSGSCPRLAFQAAIAGSGSEAPPVSKARPVLPRERRAQVTARVFRPPGDAECKRPGRR